MAPMSIEKIKILGTFLELPAKQHCQSRPFTSKLGQIGQIGSAVYLVAPKRLPGFWFFQLIWVPIMLFKWKPLRPMLAFLTLNILAIGRVSWKDSKYCFLSMFLSVCFDRGNRILLNCYPRHHLNVLNAKSKINHL